MLYPNTAFFDVDLNKYVYLDKYAEEYIGHRFLKKIIGLVFYVNQRDLLCKSLLFCAEEFFGN